MASNKFILRIRFAAKNRKTFLYRSNKFVRSRRAFLLSASVRRWRRWWRSFLVIYNPTRVRNDFVQEYRPGRGWGPRRLPIQKANDLLLKYITFRRIFYILLKYKFKVGLYEVETYVTLCYLCSLLTKTIFISHFRVEITLL